MQPPNDASDHLPINARLGRYEITGILGQGGFGITYKAWDTTLKCHVAIKEYFPRHIVSRNPDSVSIRVLAPDTNAYQRGLKSFIEEARTLARFQHPGVVPVKDILQANDTAYLVMGFVEGITLGEYLKRHDGVIAPPALLNWTGQLLDALAQVHEAGLLHRDIKPDNIYIDEAEGRALLLDFGSSRRVVAEASHSITGVISPGYSPTEQYSESTRNQGPWSDLYSLSGTLYRCITGHKPEEATIRQDEINNGDPDPLAALDPKAYPGFPEGFIRAVSRGLRIVRKDRVQSVGDFIALMEGGEGGEGGPGIAPVVDSDKASRPLPQAPAAQPSSPAPAPAVQSGSGKFGQNRVSTALATLAALAVVLLGVGAWLNNQEGDCDLQSWNTEDFFKIATPGMVRDCLAAGADIHAKTKDGRPPLHSAAAFTETPAVITTLLDAGADIHAKTKDGGTPLHWAAAFTETPAVITTLLDAGADIHAKSKYGKTPLHFAADLNDTPAVITTLLNAGADIHAKDNGGLTPWDRAQSNDKIKGTSAYRRLWVCDLQSWNTEDFFKIATPGMVRGCLAAGADIHAKDEKDGYGWTPLHWAAANTETPAILTTLLNAGADIHAKGFLGGTPLHSAAVNTENPAILTTLLNAGADIHARNDDGETPWDTAQYNDDIKNTSAYRRLRP